jgi:hypothetical protein
MAWVRSSKAATQPARASDLYRAAQLSGNPLCRRMESISFVSIGRDRAMREGEELANGMGGTRAVG